MDATGEANAQVESRLDSRDGGRDPYAFYSMQIPLLRPLQQAQAQIIPARLLKVVLVVRTPTSSGSLTACAALLVAFAFVPAPENVDIGCSGELNMPTTSCFTCPSAYAYECDCPLVGGSCIAGIDVGVGVCAIGNAVVGPLLVGRLLGMPTYCGVAAGVARPATGATEDMVGVELECERDSASGVDCGVDCDCECDVELSGCERSLVIG